MKKTLIALAAVAATGAAMAQSSVTIYGVVDVGFTDISNSGTGTDNTGLTSSNMTTNRLGFRGTEDLGGGLKANFQIETSLAADAPAASSVGDRGAWVGLSGGFGEIRLGREYSTTFWSGFLFSPFGTGGVGNGFGFINRVNAHGATGQTNPIWNNNSITYSSPRIAGFQGHAQYVFDEVAGANNAGRSMGLRLNYSAGPLGAELAYSDTDGGAALTFTAPATSTPILGLTTSAAHKSVVGGVSYNFGVARVMANFGQEKASVQATGAPLAKITNYEIGVVAPVGPGRLRAAYNNTKIDVTALATDPKVSKFALGYIYDLSKRTAVYATVASLKNKNNANLVLTGPATTGAANGRSTGYNIGISHTF
ncbi:porin [uncultured Hydrogenophaga sp.]|uniref:porin n=1 Tax=uncultured Hydrogenophaga sp. TaxID=199683 RepID=UPI00265ED0E7|nr:porin [uncultured Hydrogenophaga sp.]